MTYRIKTLMMHIITNTGSKKFSESVSYYVLNTINSCNNVRVVLVAPAVLLSSRATSSMEGPMSSSGARSESER